MGNLERRTTFSPTQFAIFYAFVGSGTAAVLVSQFTVPDAEQHGWVSVILGAIIFYAVSLVMIKLGDLFPGQDLVEFLPRIWGKYIALFILLSFIVIMLLQAAVRIQSFGREIAFFMFDRTPLEVIIMSFLGVCLYGAMQDIGTQFRICFWMFFLSMPLLIGLLLLSMINMHLINFYPLWPLNFMGILQAIPDLWPCYWAYESLLLLLPLINRSTTSLPVALAGAFLMKAGLMLLSFVAVVGSLTVEGVKQTAFPALIAVRGIELPGTFIERLDNYLLIAWIPFGYLTVAFWLYAAAQIIIRMTGYRDHRPFVLTLGIVLFVFSMGMHDMTVHTVVRNMTGVIGFSFSIIVIPATYVLARWKRRNSSEKP